MEIEVNACIDITSIWRKRFLKVLIGGEYFGNSMKKEPLGSQNLILRVQLRRRLISSVCWIASKKLRGLKKTRNRNCITRLISVIRDAKSARAYSYKQKNNPVKDRAVFLCINYISYS